MGNDNAKEHRPSTVPAQPKTNSTGESKVQVRKDKHSLVVAIDIGTYASGFAYQYRKDFETNRREVHIYKWPKARYKTTTSLLLKPDRSIDSFGSKARKTYYRFKTHDVENKPENWKNYLFFENFKMILYVNADGQIEDDLPVTAENNKTVPAVVVFSRTIEFMKNEFLKHLKNRGTLLPSSKNDATPNHIMWVITVPAIWGEPAKQLMCRAAVKAGISRENLKLALEPECAAICCSQLSPELLDIYKTDGDIERILQPDAIIMVVDIGGGTVDIAVIMINDDKTMKQVYKSGGNSYGGVLINNKILQELKIAFGEDVMREFCQTHGEDEEELHDEIESTKRELTEEVKFTIKLSHNLVHVWERHNAGKNLKEHLRTCNIEQNGNFMSLHAATFKCYFDECVESIYNYLEMVMRNNYFYSHPVNALLVVGGFAESTNLVQHLRQRLKDRHIPVIRPEDPVLCVMKGALFFGQNESMVTSRIMTKTYGVAENTKFNTHRHAESERYIDENGEERANNVFSKHIEVGQSVPTREWTQGIEYMPLYDYQKTVRVSVFQSDSEDPKHTTGEGCTNIGHVIISFPDSAEDTERKVNVEFYFAGTVIKVRAKTIRQTETLQIK